MMCPGCSQDLAHSDFPILRDGAVSKKCWKCTDWRLNRRAMDCPSCEAESTVTEAVGTYEFPYGLEGSQVQLEVTHPILTCTKCDESFSDYRGEAARDEAVKAYLERIAS